MKHSGFMLGFLLLLAGCTTPGNQDSPNPYIIQPTTVTHGETNTISDNCIAVLKGGTRMLEEPVTTVMWNTKPTSMLLKEVIIQEDTCIGLIKGYYRGGGSPMDADLFVTKDGVVILSILSNMGNDLYYVNQSASGASNIQRIFDIGEKFSDGKSTIAGKQYKKILDNLYSSGAIHTVNHEYTDL